MIGNQVNRLNGGNYFPINFDLLTPSTLPEVKNTIIRGFYKYFKSFKMQIIASLRKVYADPQDIDLFLGGVTEMPEPGALLGPTFSTIVTKQFDVLKHSDRFFYSDPSQNISFTPSKYFDSFLNDLNCMAIFLGQILELQKVSLSRVICDNNDGTIVSIQPNAFRTAAR